MAWARRRRNGWTRGGSLALEDLCSGLEAVWDLPLVEGRG